MDDLIIDLTKKKQFNVRIEYDNEKGEPQTFEALAVITAKILDLNSQYEKKTQKQVAKKQIINEKTTKEGTKLSEEAIDDVLLLQDELDEEILKSIFGDKYKDFEKMIKVGKKTGATYEDVKKQIKNMVDKLLKELSEEEKK